MPEQRSCFYPGCGATMTISYGKSGVTVHGSAKKPPAADMTAWLDALHAKPATVREDWAEHAAMVAGG